MYNAHICAARGMDKEVDLAAEIAKTLKISNKLAQALLLEVEAKELAEQAEKIIEQEMPN